MPNKVIIYVGTYDDDDTDEYISAKLSLASGKELCFIESTEITDCSPEQFLDELGTVLNDAFLISRDLGIEITLDESVEDLAEGIEEGLSDKMYQVYSEFIRKEVL